jgi:hypothetical protein
MGTAKAKAMTTPNTWKQTLSLVVAAMASASTTPTGL